MRGGAMGKQAGSVLAVLLVAQLAVAGPVCQKGTWTKVPSPESSGLTSLFNSYGWTRARDSKFGRQTVYDAPQGHLGWCGPDYKLLDDSKAVPVAIDPTYLPNGQSPYEQKPYTGHCGRYMCVRIVSNDRFCVPGQGAITRSSQYSNKDKYTTFMGQVKDQCPECEKHHIDVALQKPYTNLIPRDDYLGVGIWWVEWAFVADRNVDCEAFFAVSGAQQNVGRKRPIPRPTSHPTTPRPNPRPACKSRVKKGKQCGGLTGKKGKNVDGLWPGVCCVPGTKCRKHGSKKWTCKK